MSQLPLIQLSSIVIVGTLAQWLAWRLKLPSIVLLLLTGFIVGPVTGFINPDKLYGDLLFPLVSIAVAIILFEGGLTLRLHELKDIKAVVIRLSTLGALTTWFGVATLAFCVFDLPWSLSLLLGAILIVTGPTVVGPILRHIRPHEKLASILRWEGIITDPLGAIIAFLVFEVITAQAFEQAPELIAIGVLQSVLIGIAIGALGAFFTVSVMGRYLMPDHLHGAALLAIVIACFISADTLYPESGLLATTVMGMILANQKKIRTKHLAEFKEHLQILLISMLFIVLSARIKIDDFTTLSYQAVLFVAGTILIVRPLTIFIATLGSKELTFKDRLFLSWVAPRGIVAAAVASVFSLKLVQAGHSEASQIVPLTFLIIIITALVYGTTSLPLAYLLGVKDKFLNGVIIYGANTLARMVAETLQNKGISVTLIDSHRHNVAKAKQLGLRAHLGNVLSEKFIDSVDLSKINTALILSDNDETNSIAAIRFTELLSHEQVFQIATEPEARKEIGDSAPLELTGRTLFAEPKTYEELELMIRWGATIKATLLTEQFTYEDFIASNSEGTLLFFILNQENELITITDEYEQTPKEGDLVITLSDS